MFVDFPAFCRILADWQLMAPRQLSSPLFSLANTLELIPLTGGSPVDFPQEVLRSTGDNQLQN